MNYNRKAFTLVEMLFVVIIAMLVFSFSAYKLKGLKQLGVDKGATGFLTDLANASTAMKQDLAMQGVDLYDELRKANPCGVGTENIEVNNTAIVPGSAAALAEQAKGKTIREFLEENEYSKESFLAALLAFNYIKKDIPTTGDYKYYVSIGCAISNTCGSMSPGLDEHVVAYMCGDAGGGSSGENWSTEEDTRCTLKAGWSFMDNGLIKPREGGHRPPLDTSKNSTNPCGNSSFSCTQKTETRTYSGQVNCGDYIDSGESVVSSSYSGGQTICIIDVTAKNNSDNDNWGLDNTVWVLVDDGNGGQKSQEITCLDYWHGY